MQIREDLGLSASTLGLIVSLFFTTTALSSRLGGKSVDWLGWPRAVFLVALASAVVLGAIAAFADSTTALGVILVAAGGVNAFAVPAANLLLHLEVNLAHQGLVFGVTQAAVPAGGLLSGAAVSVIVEQFGWRSSFAFSLVLPLLLVALVPWSRIRSAWSRPERDEATETDQAPLLLLAAAGGIGAGVVVILSAFFVTSAVESGVVSNSGAGMLLVAGSVLGIVVRVATGWLEDRKRSFRELNVVAGLLVLAAVGLGFLALPALAPLLVGSILGFAGGWGWSALFFLAVVRSRPFAPAAATGTVLTGLAIGAAVGPFAFGALAEAYSWSAAWSVAAVLSLFAAIVVVWGKRRM